MTFLPANYICKTTTIIVPIKVAKAKAIVATVLARIKQLLARRC